MEKVETIEEAAQQFEKVCFGDKSWEKPEEKAICYNSFIAGAKSDAARNYWEEKINNSKVIGILS